MSKGGMIVMTLNQVAYWSLKETERSNLAREGETNRHNLVYEAETERHNRATEQNQYLSAMAAQSSAAAAHRQAAVAETRASNDYYLGILNAATNAANAETRKGELGLKENQFQFDQYTTGVYDSSTNPFVGLNDFRFKDDWATRMMNTEADTVSKIFRAFRGL